MTQKFYDEHKDFAKAILQRHRRDAEADQEEPAEVANILSRDAGGNPTPRQFKQWIGNPAFTWTTRPRGLMRTASFMSRTDQLGEDAAHWRDLGLPARLPDERELSGGTAACCEPRHAVRALAAQAVAPLRTPRAWARVADGHRRVTRGTPHDSEGDIVVWASGFPTL